MPVKISDLDESTTLASNDLFQIIDANITQMGPAGSNRKITAQNVANQLGGLFTTVPTIITSELDTKANKASPSFTGIVSLPTNTTIGDVNPNEIARLDGVTDNIQQQLDSKVGSTNSTFSGTIKFTNANAHSLSSGALHLNATTGALLFDDSGHKRISWNDGDGNFNIRAGHYINSSNVAIYAKSTTDANNGGAASIGLATDANDGAISLHVASIGAPGTAISWANSLTLTQTTLHTEGKVGIGQSTSLNSKLTLVDSSTHSAIQLTQNGTGVALSIKDPSDNTTPLVITRDGKLLSGGNSTPLSADGGSYNPTIQISGKDEGSSSLMINRFTANVNPPRLYFSKSRGTTVGSYTIVNDGDKLGQIVFAGSTGTSNIISSSIAVEVSGTPTATSVPSQIVFNTTGVGSTNSDERMRIGSNGRISIGTTDSEHHLNVKGSIKAFDDSDVYIKVSRASNNVSAPQVRLYKSRGSHATPTAASQNDVCGSLSAYAYNGYDYTSCSSIDSVVDSPLVNTGANDSNNNPIFRVPSRLVFSTTPKTSNELVEHLRINSDGNVGIGTTTPTSKLHVNGIITTGGINIVGGIDSVIIYNVTIDDRFDLFGNGQKLVDYGSGNLTSVTFEAKFLTSERRYGLRYKPVSGTTYTYGTRQSYCASRLSELIFRVNNDGGGFTNMTFNAGAYIEVVTLDGRTIRKSIGQQLYIDGTWSALQSGVNYRNNAAIDYAIFINLNETDESKIISFVKEDIAADSTSENWV